MVTWHGTKTEGAELIAAFAHNCDCTYDTSDPPVRTKMCEAHRAMVNDQRLLDGLIYARRIASKLRAIEGEGMWPISTISLPA